MSNDFYPKSPDAPTPASASIDASSPTPAPASTDTPTDTASPTVLTEPTQKPTHPHQPIKVGVAGVGNMGRNHLRVLSVMPQFELVGLFDPNEQRANAEAAHYRIPAFASFEALLAATEAVHLAIPSSLHRDYAVAAAEAGCHVLVEKPIALTLADADDIRAACKHAQVTLCVGHVERYNPAVVALADVVHKPDLISLDFQRLSPFDGRIQDTDVVHDLMVHDLEVLAWLMPEPIKRIQSQGARIHSEHLDYAQALIEYENGIVASLTASRITETKVRCARLNSAKACIVVDYLNRRMEIFRKTHYTLNVGHDIRYRQESLVEQVALSFKEPLLAEFEEFARAIVQKDEPKTNGQTARQALNLCGLIVAGTNNTLR